MRTYARRTLGSTVALGAAEVHMRFASMVDGSELPVVDPAFGACRSREGKGSSASLYVSPQDMAKRNAFSACVREHGLPEHPGLDPATGRRALRGEDAAAGGNPSALRRGKTGLHSERNAFSPRTACGYAARHERRTAGTQ
jgi:hypothetical protein